MAESGTLLENRLFVAILLGVQLVLTAFAVSGAASAASNEAFLGNGRASVGWWVLGVGAPLAAIGLVVTVWARSSSRAAGITSLLTMVIPVLVMAGRMYHGISGL